MRGECGESRETQRRDESAIDILRDDDDDYGGSDGDCLLLARYL